MWRRLVSGCLGLALMAGAAGCRSNSGLVEAALREREGQLTEVREELDRCTLYNQALEQELRALKGDVPAGAEGPVAAYPVRTLVLGRQTGGRSTDDCPGDDALQVVVEPRDPENQPIKAPGSLIVHASEVTTEGLKTPLSSWEITPEQLRRSWRSGLFTTGYVLTLPWKIWPNSEKLRVVVQLRLLDGRLFEADREVTIRVTPVNKRHTLPNLVVPPGKDSSAPDVSPAPPPDSPETAPTPRPAPDGPSLPDAADLKPGGLPLLPGAGPTHGEKLGAAGSRPPPPPVLGVRRAAKALEPRAPVDEGPVPSSAWQSIPAAEPGAGASILPPVSRSRASGP
jgi:hypothetical protein